MSKNENGESNAHSCVELVANMNKPVVWHALLTERGGEKSSQARGKFIGTGPVIGMSSSYRYPVPDGSSKNRLAGPGPKVTVDPLTWRACMSW